MHSNTEGNSPSLRAQLGVGAGRALPGAFSFQNGWETDGVNDRIMHRFSSAIVFPSQMCIEYWYKKAITTSSDILILNSSTIGGQSSMYLRVGAISGLSSALQYRNTGGTEGGIGNLNAFIDSSGTKKYDAINFKWNGVNQLKAQTFRGSAGIITTANEITASDFSPQATIDNIVIGSGIGSGAQVYMLDEIRIYMTNLNLSEINGNYNLGVGANPSRTENLWCWLDFNTAEIDTALWGVGSVPSWWTSGNYGFRDKSGNNRHFQALNVTQNATLGGQIKAF